MSALKSKLTDVVRELKERENILESDQIHLGLLSESVEWDRGSVGGVHSGPLEGVSVGVHKTASGGHLVGI